ncbi:MAG: coenzyme F420-reducing hydrogenase, partial [Lachnospiraceae bacterium]|nr:coenzyme F420-reducing hydrogenase [Lachnospiraceae bacterium]
LVLCNTDKAKACFEKAKTLMYGHELVFSDALKYQSPLRKNISKNDLRSDFIKDLQSDLTYRKINKKCGKGLTLKLWIQKYIWGNRQKVFMWNLLEKTHHR